MESDEYLIIKDGYILMKISKKKLLMDEIESVLNDYGYNVKVKLTRADGCLGWTLCYDGIIHIDMDKNYELFGFHMKSEFVKYEEIPRMSLMQEVVLHELAHIILFENDYELDYSLTKKQNDILKKNPEKRYNSQDYNRLPLEVYVNEMASNLNIDMVYDLYCVINNFIIKNYNS